MYCQTPYAGNRSTQGGELRKSHAVIQVAGTEAFSVLGEGGQVLRERCRNVECTAVCIVRAPVHWCDV